MKAGYIIAAGVLAFLLLRRQGDGPPLARVGELAEGAIMDGTNWTGDMWNRLQHAADLTDATAPNFGGTAHAQPCMSCLAGSNMAPGWDGSL